MGTEIIKYLLEWRYLIYILKGELELVEYTVVRWWNSVIEGHRSKQDGKGNNSVEALQHNAVEPTEKAWSSVWLTGVGIFGWWSWLVGEADLVGEAS